ncbi:MAG TPA: hypothetical protein VGM33_20815 [Baekduia sp.]|jgi:hypothetical protein
MSAPIDRRTDPTWYRIRYAEATQALNRSTGEDKARDARLGPAVEDYLARLRVPRGGAARRRDATWKPIEQNFRMLRLGDLRVSEAMDHAVALVQDASGVLRGAGAPVPGRAPTPRWRRVRRGPALEPQLARFLDTTVEPAAVVLFWSAAVQVGRQLPEMTPAPRPLPQRLTPAELAADTEEWLAAYIAGLLATPYSDLLPAPAARRLRRPRPMPRPNARVSYNLACLCARTAYMPHGPHPTLLLDQPLDAAAFWLDRSLRRAAPAQRAMLTRWAWRDPGLAGFRDEEPGRFGTIVGAPPASPDRDG